MDDDDIYKLFSKALLYKVASKNNTIIRDTFTENV